MSVQSQHAARIAARSAINGQPNGYQPISEAELQALKLKSANAVASDLLADFFKAAA